MKKKFVLYALGLGLATLSLFALCPKETRAQGAPGACYYSDTYCCDTGGRLYCAFGCSSCEIEEEK